MVNKSVLVTHGLQLLIAWRSQSYLGLVLRTAFFMGRRAVAVLLDVALNMPLVLLGCALYSNRHTRQQQK